MSKNTIGFAVGDRATKTADGQNNPLIMQEITVSPFNRKTSDLTDWRNANKAAEATMPRRTALYDLYYDYGTTDAQIISAWQKRVDPILSAPWEFTDKDGTPVVEINELIDCAGFDDLLTAIMNSKKNGYSMVEPNFFINDNDQNEFSVYEIPLKNMRPELGKIAYSHIGDDGINIREGIYAKTIMEFGKTTDLGLMLSACMYAILKRGNISDWAEFIEIFGRGIVDATWDGFDLEQRTALAKAIKEMGGGGVIIRPAGTSIDIKNNTGTANGDLQDKFTARMDAYISKLFLGGTETLDSSKTSGYAQSQTHQEEAEKKNDTDLNFVRRYLNSRFIKVLKAAGFDTKGGTFVLKQKNTINKESFEVHKAIAKDLGVPIDDDFWYETYGVRKPDNYETLKNEASEQKKADLLEIEAKKNALTPEVSEGKKDKKPTNSEDENDIKLSWLKRVVRLFLPAPTVTVPAVGAVHQCGEHLTVKLASFVADSVFEDLKEGLIERAWDAKGSMFFDAELFQYTAKTLTNGFSLGLHKRPTKLADIGFVYDVDDPNTTTAYEMNIFRFGGVKTLFEAQQLNELFRKSQSFKEFHDTASSMLTIHNRTWLETEYNTAMAAGESAATFARLSKQTDLFPYWQYKTVHDEKVRHSHALLHDIVLPWNHPYWKFIMPPNAWNCRCWIVPRMKGEVSAAQIKASEAKVKAYLASDAFKHAAKGGWGINRADKGQVFTENQHYTSDYLNAVGKLDKVNHKYYGLDSLETVKSKMPGIEFKPSFSKEQKDEALESFFEKAQKSTSKKYVLNDVSNRLVNITKATIAKHTNANIDKYAGRHIYLEAIPDVLKAPNEIWLNSYANSKLNNYVYLKYYKNEVLAVVTRLRDDLTLEIETWYTITDDALRSGLLIKN